MINLTPEQQAAAESKYKQTVVVSSAGSGKTTVIAARAEYLLTHDVKPD